MSRILCNLVLFAIRKPIECYKDKMLEVLVLLCDLILGYWILWDALPLSFRFPLFSRRVLGFCRNSFAWLQSLGPLTNITQSVSGLVYHLLLRWTCNLSRTRGIFLLLSALFSPSHHWASSSDQKNFPAIIVSCLFELGSVCGTWKLWLKWESVSGGSFLNKTPRILGMFSEVYDPLTGTGP